MNSVKKIITYIIIFNFINISFGQHLDGIVYELDEQDRKSPLPGVNIYWKGSQEGTASDENGKFHIDFIVEGSNKLIASFVGYLNDTIEIQDNQESVEIILSNNQMLDEYVVTERQQSSFVSQIDPLHVQNITGAELNKAACCNLSESFETNVSVDVSYSDAVSGAKKIELLGLHGKYSGMMTENIPNLRGLATTYGLGYIPGSWMESIQISKGTASVVNGYESTTGQINIEYKKPDGEEKLYLNAYANHLGKFEGNFDGAIKLNEKWSTMLFAHGETFNNKIDNNEDSFIDAPLIQQYNIFNRWKYVNDNHMAQLGFQVIEEDRTAGQMEFDKSEELDTLNYGINVKTRRYQVWGKTGYVFEKYNNTSIGFVNSYTFHDQSSYFGLNDYDGRENTYYANLILQSQFGSCRHKYSTGASYTYDDYKEQLNDSTFNRKESVPGVFFQYTYSDEKRLTILLGIRGDFHNIWGIFFTPRVHAKYNIFENTILRASAGKGYRTANIIAENSYLLASSRKLFVDSEIKQEEAWNYGINLTQILDLFDRELNINLEFYRTDFVNQVVIDRDQNASEVHIYTLDGKSFSNSYQMEAVYELIPRLDVVLAFRYNDVRMTTTNEKLEREPLVNRYKGLLNLSYKTNLDKWQFDFTTQLNGDARLPNTESNPPQYQKPENSPVYAIINAQITKYFKKWNIYIGAENLTGFTQSNPIIASDDPFGPYFDSSIVWGPIMGRKFYAGLKFIIN